MTNAQLRELFTHLEQAVTPMVQTLVEHRVDEVLGHVLGTAEHQQELRFQVQKTLEQLIADEVRARVRLTVALKP